MDTFMLRATAFGEQIITWLVLAFIYWCVDKHAGQLMAFNVSIACTWNQFIKWKCRVDRPWIRDERIVPVQKALAGAGGYSFPSGHTQRAAAVWGALGAYLWEKKARAVSTVCWVILAVIAFSRNYLGVHTPQDVLAALALGIVIICVSGRVLCWTEGGANRDIIVAGIGCLLCFLPMLKAGCLSNAGAGMGLLIGWVVERRLIGFETKGDWSKKCMRFAVGGAGVLFILTVLQPVLNMVMESKYSGFFTSFSLAVFIMAVYPFFFAERERFKKGFFLLIVLLTGILGFSVWRTQVQRAEENVVEAESESQNMDTTQEAEMKETSGSDEPDVETVAEQDAGTVTGAETENNGTAVESRLPAIIAHRGYSSEFPENTLAAFEGALDIGVDYIELDVQLTKDGQAVIFHDDDLKRITGVEGRVSEYTYDELRGLDAGSWFSSSFAGERIPSLREALELISSSECSVYLELKDIGEGDGGFEETVLDMVKECCMLDKCVVAYLNYAY
ncbi:MAG: phosphatase PAP2 family protein, partial [Lachnospiraceae bacterium]|nr:phosphatase PAP2 family protein [Lachnospiraceae bacterium]